MKKLTTVVIIALLAVFLFNTQAARANAETNSMSGTIWQDDNGNGIYEPNEKATAGVTIRIQMEGNDEHFTAVTDANGNFILNEMQYGRYTIQVVDVSGQTIVQRATVVGEVMGLVEMGISTNNAVEIVQDVRVIEDTNEVDNSSGFTMFLPVVSR